MKAVVCTRYGPPEVLQLREVAKPAPTNKEVLIRIYATAVTASDCIMRGATLRLIPRLMMRVVLGFTKPRKSILGLVVAGDIEAVGRGVTRFRPGDRVYGFTGFGFGSYAEYTCMPEEESIHGCLASKPVTISYE